MKKYFQKGEFLTLLKDSILNNRGLLLSFLSILTGIITGAFVYNISDDVTKSELTTLITAFNAEENIQSFFSVFTKTLSKLILYLLLMIFTGSSIFGKELSLIVTSIKFSGTGLIISHLYSFYMLKGFEYVLLVFMPGKLLLFFAALILTECCFDFSNEIRRRLKNKTNQSLSLKNYIIKILISSVSLILSSLIESFNIYVFLDLFEL